MMAENWNKHAFHVADNVSSWDVGDKLVIATSDYDMDHAEQVTITSKITDYHIEVEGDIRYTHLGQKHGDMEMRAEVGLLTRNVLIHGEMGDECIPGEEQDLCNIHHFDNFGGHIKATFNFTAFNIEGAELTNMGQMTELGSYPIHFHMCKDTDNVTSPIIKRNSIHHSFRLVLN